MNRSEPSRQCRRVNRSVPAVEALEDRTVPAVVWIDSYLNPVEGSTVGFIQLKRDTTAGELTVSF